MTNSLIVAPQWIGDAVMTEPLLRRLHARGERLTVGALPWVAPVYRAMPQVAEVVIFPFAHGGLQWRARRDMATRLRGCFDTAYVCPNSLKSALIPWWAGIARRVGYRGESRLLLLNQRLPNPPKGERPPMVAFYSALCGDADVTADRPALHLDPALLVPVLQTLDLHAQGYYVFAPGAEYGPAKRWPAAHFASLAAQLMLPVVLLGSAKESALCADIAAQAQALGGLPCVDLSGRTSLDQALAVIAAAKAMVSNDSGLMHVAAAFGTPQVAVFGSSSPLHTPPLNSKAQVTWLKNDANYQPPLDCAPCFQRECPLGHTRCLVDIAPQQVLALLPL
jgi:heptosyltransferase-2